MASADFSLPCDNEISPGNGTLLRCTAAAFTSTGRPDVFGVLCHLDAPRRPSIRFLFIGSQFSHSLPSRVRSPSRAWPLVVVSFHFWYSYRGLEPHLQRAHAGHTQAHGEQRLTRSESNDEPQFQPQHPIERALPVSRASCLTFGQLKR
jgi:hypothetical protein